MHPGTDSRSNRTAIIAAALVALATWTGLSAGLAGCDEELVFSNALPRVTWVSVAPPDGEGVAEVTVWVRDLEGDPVDLALEWSSGGAATPIALAPGGHGLSGLTTAGALGDPNGRPHLIRWDTAGVPGDAPITLRFVADDGEDRSASDRAATAVTSPAFTLSEGLETSPL